MNAVSETPTAEQLEVVTIQAGVLLHDSASAFLRLLDLAGVQRLTGQPGQVGVACPGGGSLLTDKLAQPIPTLVASISTVFTMTANQCRFSSRDGLVYNGVWEVQTKPATITYSASGACAATCNAGQIDVVAEKATLGYGVADNMAMFTHYDLLTTNNVHQFNTFFSGDRLTLGEPGLAVFGGNQSNTLPLSAAGVNFDGKLALVDSSRGYLSTVVTVSGTRDTLKITAPFKAALQVSDAGVTAAVDSYGSTSAHTTAIPWSAFLD